MMMDDIDLMAEFELAVYRIVALIPAGSVATYGQIAELAGISNAARLVGRLVSNVPAGRNLPCHRVVNKSGAMAPDFAFGGQGLQRAMLEDEGVTFTVAGRIDMKRHLWNAPDDEVELYGGG